VNGASKAAKLGGKLNPIRGIKNLFKVDEEEDEQEKTVEKEELTEE